MLYCGVGGGGSCESGIRLISLDFQRYAPPITEEEARKLIIGSLNDYLESANKDEKIRPFFKNYPIIPKNVYLAIYIYNSDRYDIYHPFISAIIASQGEIGYFTEDESSPFKYRSKKYETYEEAVAILQQEKK